MGKMFRPISQFTGEICVVGRGWAESLSDARKGENPAEAWYRWDHSYHEFEPVLNGINVHKAYYIDRVEDIAADYVCDMTLLGEPEHIGDNRFAYLLFEFLPDVCFQNKNTLANAIRIVKNGGRIVVHTRDEFAETAKARIRESGFEITVRDLRRKHIIPAWALAKFELSGEDAEQNEQFLSVETVVKK
jgi:hypothetical protein